MSDSELETIRERWTRRLSKLRRRLRYHQAAEAVAVLLAGVVVAVVLTGLLDYRFELSLVVRRCLLGVGFGVLAWAGWRRLMRPLLTKLDLLDVAALVDRTVGLKLRSGSPEPAVHRPVPLTEVGRAEGTVVASVARVLDASNDSSPLIRKAVAQSDQRLSSVPMDGSISGRHLLKSLGSSAGALIVPLAILVAAPAVSRVWASRWITGSDEAYPRSTTIQVLGLDDGVLRVPRGEPARVSVQVVDRAEATQVVWMRLQPTDGDRLTSTLDGYGVVEDEAAAFAGDDRSASILRTRSDFRGDLPALAGETPAMVWGGDARPVEFLVQPVDRPQVVALDLVAKHPKEAEPQSFDLMSTTDVRLLRDTVARLTVRSTVPVEAAFETKSDVDVERVDEHTSIVSWVHSEPTALRVSLTSTASGLESFPRTVPIGLLPDRAPSITLRHSGVRLRVSKMASIPLSVTARDDFGVASVVLNGDAVRLQIEGEVAGDAGANGTEEVRLEPEESASGREEADGSENDEAGLALSAGGPKKALPPGTGPIELYQSGDTPELRIDREHVLELLPLELKPGDVVKVAATAHDDAYGGAQERKSRTITFRVVKEDDLFREILLKLQQLRSRLRKATDSADELRTAIMTAALPRDGATLGRKFQVGRREVGAVTQQIKQTVTEMQLNKLGGEEADEMNELIDRTVIRPLERLLAGSMDRQRGALGDLAKSSSNDLETDRQEAVERQQEIVDSLNEVLKNMSQWDSFVDVVNQLNAVIGIERTVRTRTEELRTGESPAVIDPIGGDKPKDAAADPGDAAADIFD